MGLCVYTHINKKQYNHLYWKKYYNPERERERRKRYDKRKYYSTDKQRIYSKRYRATLKGRLANRLSEHRRRLFKVETDITPKWVVLLFRRTKVCCLCDSKMEENGRWPNGRHLDHIVPLACGGKHVMSNVRFICARCNLKRGRKLWWTSKKGQLSLPFGS